MSRTELYVSTDIEANGPIPGIYSMLSLGSCLFDENGQELSSFSANLELLDGAAEHPDTSQFWKENPEAYQATRLHIERPVDVMNAYSIWLDTFPRPKIFVAYPVGFDFTFVYWYFHRFLGKSPFYHSAVDIRTYGMALMGTNYLGSTKKTFPRAWMSANMPHTHYALQDAREQGILFCNMLKYRRQMSIDNGRDA